MCTDNMPSGSAMKLGDVLTIRNGKTVEIHNTDAEGRLILADGLSLAVEDQPDAIVDIATLTGAALGRSRPGNRRRARHQSRVHLPGGGLRRPHR
jgi:leucyl aminopeptidase